MKRIKFKTRVTTDRGNEPAGSVYEVADDIAEAYAARGIAVIIGEVLEDTEDAEYTEDAEDAGGAEEAMHEDDLLPKPAPHSTRARTSNK